MSATGLHQPSHKLFPGFTGRSAMLITSGMVKMLVQLTVILIYSRTLSIEDYGQYQSVWLYTGIISVISLFGLPALILSAGWQTVLAYLRKHRNQSISIALILFVVPFGLFLIFEPGFTLFQKLLLALMTIAQNIAAVREVIALKNGKHTKVLWVNILYSALFLVAHLLLNGSNYSLDTLLLCLIIVFIIKSTMLHARAVEQQQEETIPANLMGKQWIFLGLFDTINTLYKWLDKWIILYFLTVSQFAIYFNGAYEIPVFGIMVSAVGNIMLVEWGREKTNKEHVQQLLHQSSNMLAGLVFPAFAFLVIYHEPFFLLMFGKKYAASVTIFFIALFILPLRITNYTAALQTYHRSDKIVQGSIIDLIIAIVLMFVFYPILNIEGIMLAIVLSTWVQAIYYLFATAKITKLPLLTLLPFKNLFLIMAASLVACGAAFYFTQNASTLLHLGSGIVIALMIAIVFSRRYFKQSSLFSKSTT